MSSSSSDDESDDGSQKVYPEGTVSNSMDADLWHAILRTAALLEARMDFSIFGNTPKAPDGWKPDANYNKMLDGVTLPEADWTETKQELKIKLDAMHAAIKTLGCATAIFSMSIELIHSPPDLMTSLLRSVICI